MFRNTLLAGFSGMLALLIVSPLAWADDEAGMSYGNVTGMQHHTNAAASSHAPIGVMGDHMHGQGEWMLSYRYMHMSMDGNLDGNDDISPVTIATTVPNRFFGMAGQPPTLRVVPTSMDMDMHMFGAMYAPTDWLTLMAMAMWQHKEMEHITFAGGAGSAVLGRFTAESNGWGDTSLSGLIKLYRDKTNKVHMNLGISAPTGQIDQTATVLAPNNTTPRLRMPYAMQLGTGTWDLLAGLSYSGHKDQWGWGAQYTARIPLENENSEGYAWGDKHSVTVWGSYQWQQWISTSLRLTGTTQDDIKGIDPNIVAPVQTADPDNYGGTKVDAAFGVNLIAVNGPLADHRLAFEVSAPLYQDLNGPQLKDDWRFTIGWQKAF